MYYPWAPPGNISTFTPSAPAQPSGWDNNVYIIWTIRIFLFFGIPFLLHKIYQYYQTRRSPRRARHPNRGRAMSTLNTVIGLVEAILGQSSMSNLIVDFELANTMADGNASDLALSLHGPDESAAAPQMQRNATQRPMPTYDRPRNDLRRGLDGYTER